MARGSANSGSKNQKGRSRFTYHKGAHGRNRGQQQNARATGRTTKGGGKKGS